MFFIKNSWYFFLFNTFPSSVTLSQTGFGLMVTPNLTGDCGITSSEEGLYEIVMIKYN